MSYRYRAPGKAVLMGEYAVTDGLPAFAVAVDRFADVALTPCAHDQAGLSAPQVWPESIGFRIGEGCALDWETDSAGWSRVRWTAGLIDRLIDVLNPSRLEPFRLRIDTASLFIEHEGQRSKLGLGSSSAIAVGLFAVLAKHLAGGRSLAPDAVLTTLLPVYQDAQGGQGSGIDLAAAIHGGLIEFRNRQGETSARALEWPEGLMIDFVWTGKPASTPKLLAQYREWQKARPHQAARWHRMADNLLEAGRAALGRGDAEELLGLLGEYGRGMSTMGRWMGVDLTPDVHLGIMQQAERLGLAAKPSGAGVGDLALIAGTCADAMAQMRRWLRSQRIPRLDMQPAHSGAFQHD